ncbi:uncharacterized protein LOC142221192 [Haematobia irritans]|uniref:uncharacterized protein LOC142221192 n=1 Tax=Haematobia irritans TaxID=7368 RepID=UPI003F50A526
MCENSTWHAPLWLDDTYLENVLRKYLKDDSVIIENVDIRPANPNGENFASVMSRIRITFKQSKSCLPQELSFIMKYTYESDPFVAKIMAGYDIYNTEMKMYEQILPQLADILNESGDMEKLFADTLKVDYERSTIIFEDLSVMDYVVANRTKGLDMAHASMVLKKLAKFHAAAAVLNERQNGCLEKFDHGIFNRHTRGFASIFENFLEEVAKFAKDCPDLGQYYHDKLMKLSNHIVEYATKAYTINRGHFFTLSHGDLWTTNIMMLYEAKEEEKSLMDAMLIDFQFCNWSMASVDWSRSYWWMLKPRKTLASVKYSYIFPNFREYLLKRPRSNFSRSPCKRSFNTAAAAWNFANFSITISVWILSKPFKRSASQFCRNRLALSETSNKHRNSASSHWLAKATERWVSFATCEQTKLIWDDKSRKNCDFLMATRRDDLRALIGMITEHNTLGKHMRQQKTTTIFCVRYNERTELQHEGYTCLHKGLGMEYLGKLSLELACNCNFYSPVEKGFRLKIKKFNENIVMSVSEIIKNFEKRLSVINENSGALIQMDYPIWLTKDYMESCLKSYYKNERLKLLKMHVKPALGKGENYGGILIRIKAEYQPIEGSLKTGSYIVKTSYEGDEFARKAMEPYDIFNREIEIYEKILPKIKDLLKEAGDEEQIFAETIMVDRENSALIFEDLNEHNFEMADRIKGLDMDIAKIVLRKLAKMHACSAVLNQREKGCLEHYNKGIFNRHTDVYAPCFVGFFEACIRMVAQWSEYRDLTAKLKSLVPLYMELNKQVFDPIETHLNVFAHGDLWTNNILIKYDKENRKPLDVIIIDFQYSAWTSPAVDLHYFLNTSMQEDIHVHHQDQLVYHYYGYLKTILEKLNYKGDIPSLHKFHQQLQEKAFYAMHSTCAILPIQRNDVNDDADFGSLMKNDEKGLRFKNTCYRNPYVQKMIRQLLPFYDQKGLLDKDQ